jgi:hypothetical protein
MRHEEVIKIYEKMLESAADKLIKNPIYDVDSTGQLHDIIVAKSVIEWIMEEDGENWKEELEKIINKEGEK